MAVSCSPSLYSLPFTCISRDPDFSSFPSQCYLKFGSSQWLCKRGIREPNAPLKFHVLCMRRRSKAVVTGNSWEKSILKSEIPVLVEFYASWCGPCRMVHRVIDELAEEYAGKLKCFILNTDDDFKVAEEYEIKAVPVVFLFKNGVKCDSIVGTMPKDFYVAAIEKLLVS